MRQLHTYICAHDFQFKYIVYIVRILFFMNCYCFFASIKMFELRKKFKILLFKIWFFSPTDDFLGKTSGNAVCNCCSIIYTPRALRIFGKIAVNRKLLDNFLLGFVVGSFYCRGKRKFMQSRIGKIKNYLILLKIKVE